MTVDTWRPVSLFKWVRGNHAALGRYQGVRVYLRRSICHAMRRLEMAERGKGKGVAQTGGQSFSSSSVTVVHFKFSNHCLEEG